MTDDSDPDSAVVAALAEQVVDLDTVAPGVDTPSLAPLREVVAGRRVVGLGEATRGEGWGRSPEHVPSVARAPAKAARTLADSKGEDFGATVRYL